MLRPRGLQWKQNRTWSLLDVCVQPALGWTPGSTLHGSPELKTFPDDETGRIKLHLHVRHDLIHRKIVDFPRRRFLCSKVRK